MLDSAIMCVYNEFMIMKYRALLCIYNILFFQICQESEVNFELSRVILHCDMNNFFASVECLLDPRLRDKRVAVCGRLEERHGIVLAKNENAKAFGVKTGDTIWEAKRKCPKLVTVPPQFKYYVEYSIRAREIYKRYTDLVEPFGLDECWLDVTGSTRLFGSGEHMADELRKIVKEELGLTISVGVSFNKVFAKLGSDLKKPDGTTVISEDNFRELIYHLPASDMIGVGRSTSQNLRRIGVETIGELAALTRETLKIRLGKNGEALWRYANGLDNSKVVPEELSAPAKSIGRGITTVRDLVNCTEVHAVMLSLCIEIARKLRAGCLAAAMVQVSVRDNRLVTREFQCALPFETANAGEIEKCAFELFCKRYDWERPVRSVTVRAAKLAALGGARQLDFSTDVRKLERREIIDGVVDRITERYGKGCVKPLSLIGDIHIPNARPDGAVLPGFNIRG